MKKLRIGLIGAAGRANLAQHWHAPRSAEAEVVAASDVSTKAFELCRQWISPDVRMHTDYRDVVNAADVDAVAVFTPDWLHEEHALAVLNAGKHLYLEKPMALSVEACDRILKAWRDQHQAFMIGFNLRYNPVALKAREIVRSGRLGDVKAIWVRHFVGAGGDFYYHDWHCARADVHSLLLQKASHDFDLIHWIADAYTTHVAAFGDRDYFGGARPNDLTCADCDIRSGCREEQAEDSARQLCAFRRAADVEDNHVVILQLANGVKASYMQCHFTPEYLRNYTVIGTAGRLEFDLEKNRLWVLDRPEKTRDWGNERAPEEVLLHKDGETYEGHGGADPLIARAFIDAIVRGEKPVSTPVAGRMSVAVGCAAVDALLKKTVMPVMPMRGCVSRGE